MSQHLGIKCVQTQPLDVSIEELPAFTLASVQYRKQVCDRCMNSLSTQLGDYGYLLSRIIASVVQNLAEKKHLWDEG